ncbi:MAG: hypothetical protein K2X49_14510 [Acetobacteraceae bacterium]|nr:hypothetical protein [Acetobacteraceae bacterium]
MRKDGAAFATARAPDQNSIAPSCLDSGTMTGAQARRRGDARGGGLATLGGQEGQARLRDALRRQRRLSAQQRHDEEQHGAFPSRGNPA